jgi:hypothetical protein
MPSCVQYTTDRRMSSSSTAVCAWCWTWNLCCSWVACHQQSITAISIVLAAQANISKPLFAVQPNGPAIVCFDFKCNLHTICIAPARLQTHRMSGDATTNHPQLTLTSKSCKPELPLVHHWRQITRNVHAAHMNHNCRACGLEVCLCSFWVVLACLRPEFSTTPGHTIWSMNIQIMSCLEP